LRPFRLASAVILSASLAACVVGRRVEPTEIPSPTPVPSETPVPTASTPLAVLVLPADMDKSTSDAYQKTVYDLAQQSGFRFQVRNAFAPGDIDPGLRILIALPPDPGVAALAAAAPSVQFLAINIPGITAGGNISTLAGGGQSDMAAFVAGYTAALISDDFRAGMIMPQNDAGAQRSARAFANGMAYYCGLCTSFRLYIDQNGQAVRYPQFVEIPQDEDPSRFGGWANYLAGSLKVNAVFVYPDPRLEVRQLYDSLGQTGAQIIGTDLPDPKPAGWVMDIRPDEVKAIERAWPDLVAGKGGETVPSPLGLGDVDPVFLGPGKERLVRGVLDELQAGRILTGVGQ
jgi:hypothetical protein